MTLRSGHYRRLDSMARFAVELNAMARLEVNVTIARIPEDMRFVDWVEGLAPDRTDPVIGEPIPGLRIDGKRFDLSDRAAMRWIYEQMPSTRAEAVGRRIILMKCSQVGFTWMEMLWGIFFCLKYEPISLGFFLPDVGLARGKSSQRFLPILDSMAGYGPLIAAQKAVVGVRGKGTVEARWIGGSIVRFLWTTGRSTTESYSMDVISFDEVQEMLIADMEKADERLSASDLKFRLMGSTANWPDADIHHWFKKGSQHRFFTRCPTCGVMEPLDDYFPDCIRFDPGLPDRVSDVPGDYRYVCRAGHWIDDPQDGEWRPMNPDALDREVLSIHFHQMLSPTISPREIWEAYIGAESMKNFYNRKLGKPWADPSQIPVNLEHLNKCAQEGMRLGLQWKTRARDTFMGIDQMGAFNVVIIKERLADGRQGTIWVEEIYDADPFARCDEIMRDYGVQVCVVEQLPNFNDALRFANRWPGRVFLANYGDLKDETMRWGDAPKLGASERRTTEDDRSRYTVTLDQYKCMSLALKRLVNTICLFPDPSARVQEVRDKEARMRMALLKDRAFVHFQKTALVTERMNDEERKFRRKVIKVGIDPHFSYANMLCDVAWARAHGTATFVLPGAVDPETEKHQQAVELNAPGLPPNVVAWMEPRPDGQVCGRCRVFPMEADGPPMRAYCKVWNAMVGKRDQSCAEFDPVADDEP